jgi:hypothetical protein
VYTLSGKNSQLPWDEGEEFVIVEVEIDGASIGSEDAFHDVFSEKLGFPGYYGRNWNAWMDCMEYVDDPETGMCSRVQVEVGSFLLLRIENSEAFKSKCKKIFYNFLECAASVNLVRVLNGQAPVIIVAL